MGAYRIEDADYVILGQGSVVTDAEAVADFMRKSRDVRVGVINLRMFRPFPADLITKLVGVFTENAEQIKKISFPKICLAAIAVGISLINNGLLLVAIFFIFASLGYLPGHYVAWLPLLMLVTTMLATGVGLVLGVLNVFVRDVGQVVPVVLQVLYWLTPIVYGVEMLGDGARRLVESNPLYPLVASFQNVIAFNRPPDLEGLALLALGALAIAAAALFLFRRASAEMADVL